ncbi:SDR family NAD(P)-dependent oxidoreductase [Bauldia sp.]|uniref:SDR family NAD(P)-dependent oxidoreductase n=1 Tax=Bauldia sp. TaxID=2575872 RepID=UPI003BAC2384
MADVMIVTGASRGIGAAIAQRAGRAGWDVAVNFRLGEEAAEAVAAEIRNSGGRAITVQADMAKEADVERLFTAVDDQLGPVRALVNNAGIIKMTSITEFDTTDFDRLFAVNVRGAMIAAREAARRMAGRGGIVVNISSVSAQTGGGPQGSLYAASKGALDSLTLGLARELAPEGIRVCGVRPGMTETEIFDDSIGLPAARERAADRVPLGRLASPEEIAAMVIWLCGPEASYVTGVNLDVTGGI